MQVTPGEKVSVAPGMHYLHVLADGVISGRQRIEVTSGAEVSVPFFVDHTELSLAKSKVVNGVTTGFPESVKSAIESIAKSRKGAIFVGAMDDNGQPVILPYARGAKLAQNRKGAFILFGGAGFALSKSKILDEEGLVNEDWVPTGLAQFGFEASYSYFCVTAGVDASVPSGRSVRFGTPDGETAEDDQSTLILPQPWFGVGSYILRPFDNSHTLLVAATMEYLFPAHTGVRRSDFLGLALTIWKCLVSGDGWGVLRGPTAQKMASLGSLSRLWVCKTVHWCKWWWAFLTATNIFLQIIGYVGRYMHLGCWRFVC